MRMAVPADHACSPVLRVRHAAEESVPPSRVRVHSSNAKRRQNSSDKAPHGLPRMMMKPHRTSLLTKKELKKWHLGPSPRLRRSVSRSCT